jgi:hypothetical protein
MLHQLKEISIFLIIDQVEDNPGHADGLKSLFGHL